MCTEAVKKALTTADTFETKEIEHWLHPSALMNLNLWDDVKSEAQKIGHDFILAGQKCGNEPLCLKIVNWGTAKVEESERSLVLGWINSNEKVAWCKNNSTCMDIVNHALMLATVEETYLINEWLGVS